MTKEEGIPVATSSRHSIPIQLGFCEPIDNISFVAHRSANWIHWDGGQVGGRPSWLQPRDLPHKPLSCRSCTTPLTFICQLYAPDDDIQEAFHRSLYVFACPQPSCVPEIDMSIRVLRVQLPQVNPFYPPTKSDEDDNNDDDEWNQHLPEYHGVHVCAVCGQRGKGKCPKQGLYFCGRDHQIEYNKYPTTALPSCYQCHELVVDEEPSIDESTEHRETLFATDDNDDNGNDSDEDLEQHDLNAMTGARQNKTSEDGTTFDFYSRMRRAKQQCVRYSKWQDHQEVWIRSDHQPSIIPPCPTCGAPRKFECQIMPQLLQYLFHTTSTTEMPSQVHQQAFLAATNIVNEASSNQVPPMLKERQEEQLATIQQSLLKSELDWGTICIYTCTKSCDRPEGIEHELGAYHEEYAWKQPPLD